MFQCIIQQRNGWIHAPNPEFRDVFPGNCLCYCCFLSFKFSGDVSGDLIDIYTLIQLNRIISSLCSRD